MSSYDSTNENEEQSDQNGNFSYTCSVNPKTSAFKILSDTLCRSHPGSEHILNRSAGLANHLHEELTTLDILNENENESPTNSECSFNPGDTLSSPFPPLVSGTLPNNNAPPGTNSKNKSNLLLTKGPSGNTTPYKKCHLSTVLGSARRCLKQLIQVKEGLSCLASQDEQLSKGKKIFNPGSDYELIASLGEYIMYLTRQAFTPAHRLYTAALGLHMSEDLIRNPTDPALLNFKMGYVERPGWTSIIHTQIKLRACVDSATEVYHKFGREASSSVMSHVFEVEQMQQVMVTLMHAFQDLYATALGSADIFKVLLHIEEYGETILQEFLLSLESMERSDLLLQVQALRRSFDDIVIMIEQLSWAAYVVNRLASGKSLTPSPDQSMSKLNGGKSESKGSHNKVDNVNQSKDTSSFSQKKPNSSKTSLIINPGPSNSKSRDSLIPYTSSSSSKHGLQSTSTLSQLPPNQNQSQNQHKHLAGYSQALQQYEQQKQLQLPHGSSSRHSSSRAEPSHQSNNRHRSRSHKENKDRDRDRDRDRSQDKAFLDSRNKAADSRNNNGKSIMSSPSSASARPASASTPTQGRSRKNSVTNVRPQTTVIGPHSHGKNSYGGNSSISKSSLSSSGSGSGSKTISMAGYTNSNSVSEQQHHHHRHKKSKSKHRS